jgi:hypothetical protein
MFVSAKYIALLEKQIADLHTEKADLRLENARLLRLLIPALQRSERSDRPVQTSVVLPHANKPVRITDVPTKSEPKLERVPARGWMQAKAEAERLTEEAGPQAEEA